MPDRLGSNVEFSSGADKDVMSFYSTTSSTAFKDPVRIASPRKIPEIETGFSKNAVARYQFALEDQTQYETTYRRSVNENLSLKQSSDVSPRAISADSSFQGGYPTATRHSPIKWSEEAYRRLNLIPSKRILQQRQKHDPIEWENNGQGPADFSTSFRTSWVHPQLQKQKIITDALSPSSPPTDASTKESASSGWKENNIFREHPWLHPGAPDHVTSTYSSDTRIPRKSESNMSDMSNRDTFVSQTDRMVSGFARHTKKVILGTNTLSPEDRLSTTHLSYVKGRSARGGSPTAVIEVAHPKPGEPLGQSGFSRAYNNNPDLVLPHASAELTNDLQTFRTTTSSHFGHPGWPYTGKSEPGFPAAGSSSAYSRSISAVNSIASFPEPPLTDLHPTVATSLYKRDPYFYHSKTFKITTRPVPERIPIPHVVSPTSSDQAFPRSPAGLPSARLSILATVLRN